MTFNLFISGDLITASEQFEEAKLLRASLPSEFKDEVVSKKEESQINKLQGPIL